MRFCISQEESERATRTLFQKEGDEEEEWKTSIKKFWLHFSRLSFPLLLAWLLMEDQIFELGFCRA